MKMKSISSVILALFAVFSLCSCGNSATETADNMTSTAATTVFVSSTTVENKADTTEQPFSETASAAATVAGITASSKVTENTTVNTTKPAATTVRTNASKSTKATVAETTATASTTKMQSKYTAEITLSSSAIFSGKGVTVSGSTVTVKDAGTYRIKGSFNGQIVIDNAAKSARMLNEYLTKATNATTGKIDFTALSHSLKSANTDLATLSNNLLAMGPKGQ